MSPILLTVALAVALFIGAGVGYYVRYLHAISKKSSLELTLKQKEVEAEQKAITVIEKAEEKAEKIEQEAKDNRKQLEEKLEQKEERLNKREELLDDRQIDVDSQKEALNKATPKPGNFTSCLSPLLLDTWYNCFSNFLFPLLLVLVNPVGVASS